MTPVYVHALDEKTYMYIEIQCFNGQQSGLQVDEDKEDNFATVS